MGQVTLIKCLLALVLSHACIPRLVAVVSEEKRGKGRARKARQVYTNVECELDIKNSKEYPILIIMPLSSFLCIYVLWNGSCIVYKMPLDSIASTRATLFSRKRKGWDGFLHETTS